MKSLQRFFRKIRRSKTGFSLLEVIIATAITMIISSTMLPLFVQGNYYIARARAIRAQASEANESIKLSTSDIDSSNEIYYSEDDSTYDYYKIRTSLILGPDAGDIKTGGAAQEYIFVRASSSNEDTETIVYYVDFKGVDD